MNTYKKYKFFNLVKVLLFAYPLRTAVLVVLQLIAGLADGITMTALLPLLMIITGDISSVGQSFIIDKIINLMNSFQIDLSVTSALLIIISFTLLKTILMLITARQVGYTSAHVAKDLRLKLIKSLLNTSWSHITKTKTGNLAHAIIFETEVASDSYVKLSRVIPNIVQVAVYLILSFFISFYVTIGGVIWAGFSAFSLRWLITISRKAGEDQVNLMKSISAKLVDVFQAFKPLKAMSKEDQFVPILEKETIELEAVQRRKVFSKESLVYLQELIIVISLSSGLYYFLVYQKTTLAPIMMLIILFQRALQRVGRLQQAYQMIREGESAFWSVYNRIEQNIINGEAIHGKSKVKFENEIRLINLSFTYNKEELISNVNISIPKGKFVSLSGPSGSGKTTLIDIIIGLYQPNKGELLIDGVSLKNINQRSWRNMIGYVPQETVLINDTIYQNISLGNNSIKREKVINALKSSGCEEFIDLTNNGLNQVIYEKGQNLSGGQRQRISIARAIVNDPKLLILDEATTALDPQTESSIINTLNDLKGNMAIIAISHQPQINAAAEKKYVIKNNTVDKI